MARGTASGFIRSNVVGLVAIFIALGGTALALPGRNTVNSGDIINGQVKNKDLRANAVNAAKVADGSLGAAEFGADSLTGAVIDESTLAGVPGGPPSGSAGGDLTGTYPNPTIGPDAVGSGEVIDDSLGSADISEGDLDEVPEAADADLVGGHQVRSVTDNIVVLNGLTVLVACTPGSPNSASVAAFTSVDNSKVAVQISGGDLAYEGDFDSSEVPSSAVTTADPSDTGTATVLYQNGTNNGTVSVELAWRADYAGGCPGGDLEAFGRAIG